MEDSPSGLSPAAGLTPGDWVEACSQPAAEPCPGDANSSPPHGLETPVSSAFPSPPQHNEVSPLSNDVGGKERPTTHKEKLLRLLGDKESQWHEMARKLGPLQLLDLPLDVLHLIVKEITHTNDLVSLALTHTALHRMAIAQIYSRFDIVWPDNSTQPETRTGVDALTYGLATLVMSEDVFGESSFPTSRPLSSSPCTCCGHCNVQDGASTISKAPPSRRMKRRRGNYYAEFTRKFSLGNGPEDWIKEYLAHTESGKMLGTLVALAVARMHNLETFVWDMPTGILLDVWNALASLGERESSRLEKIWIRWHNNSNLVDGKFQASPPPHPPHTFWLPYSRMTEHANTDKRNKVERPIFSMLSPLKSINVLDIDECIYLDEMSILICESLDSLKELRVGIASHAVSSEWAFPSQEDSASQRAEGKSRFTGNISLLEKRLGGVLGVLTGYFFDLKKHRGQSTQALEVRNKESEPKLAETTPMIQTPNARLPTTANHTPTTTRGGTRSARFVEDIPPSESTPDFDNQHKDKQIETRYDNLNLCSSGAQPKLRLEILALERVSLSIPVMSEAFDWKALREISLIDCQFTASFWHALRRRFTPIADQHGTQKPSSPAEFPLRLRKIHINTVTPMLLAFMKETLCENTLEVLILQQSEYHLATKVTSTEILRVIKRHRGSLRKILIDSSDRDETDNGSPLPEGWDRWIFDRKMVHFVTSGKVPKLRELGMAMKREDWHYLLQRLPLIPHIRALYLPYIEKSDKTHVPSEDAKELALQVLDILTLRPDVQLCYLAIANKCFEVIESRVTPSDLQLEEITRADFGVAGPVEPEDGTEADEDEDEDEEDEEEDGDADGDGGEPESEAESEEDALSSDEDIEHEPGEEERSRVKMEVREILFYDDKVTIFKARHGRL